MMAENIERELGWEDEIDQGSEFSLIPEGDYNFEVTMFRRGQRYEGGGKIPPCNRAVVEIKVFDENNETTLEHDFLMHSKMQFLLHEFFSSLGFPKRDDGSIKMDWDAAIGKKGKCRVVLNKYTNKKGEEREINKISQFYDPEPNAEPSAAGMF